MLSEIYPINCRIEVGDSGENARFYPSRVEDIIGEALVVAAPLFRRTVVRFGVGSAVTVVAKRPEGLYALLGRVESEALRPQPLMRLSVVEPPRRYERRQFVRVPVLIQPVELMLSPTPDEAAMGVTATMIDLSGAGMGIKTRSRLTRGACGRARFSLPGSGDFDLPVEVSRIAEEKGGQGDYCYAGCHFQELTVREKERVLRFLWRQQASLRRKGLL